MTAPVGRAQADRRARRLLRWYPRSWRDRYGEELAEVLSADIVDRPRSVGRTFDVARAAVGVRLCDVGLFDTPGDPAGRVRSGVGLVYLSLALFVVLGAGVWSQLRTGLSEAGVSGARASAPLGISAAVLSVALAAGVVLSVIALGSVVTAMARTVRSGAASRVAGPVLTLAGVGAVLTGCGWVADRTSWFTPAGAALPAHGPLHLVTLWVRGLVAAITPAWVHPTMLGHLPAGELCSVVVAPIAAIVGAVALARLVRRAPHSARAVQVDAAVAKGVVAVMAMFGAGAAVWVMTHPFRQGSTAWAMQVDPLAPGHTGRIVVLVLLLLTGAAALGARRIGSGLTAADTT